MSGRDTPGDTPSDTAGDAAGDAGAGSPGRRLEVSAAVLRERYAAGESVPQIAKGMGLTARQVYLRMQREGIARRPSGAPKWETFPITAEELRRRYEAGESMVRLGRALGVSERAVKLRLAAAGTVLRPAPQGRMALPVSSQELRRRYEAGESLYDLAIDLDISVGTVQTRVLEAGGTLRPVGGRVGRNALALPVTNEELRDRYEAGASMRNLAGALGVDEMTVRSRVKAARSKGARTDG